MDYKFSKTVKTLGYAALFLIPLFVLLLVIHSHSDLLITTLIACVICVLLEAAILFLVAYIIVSKNRGIALYVKKLPIILAGVFAVLCLAFGVILYGPYTGFRHWLITTAMSTMSHQHYCKWFYSDEEIARVQKSNFVAEVDEKTDTDLIDTDKDSSKDVNPVELNEDDGMSEGIVADTEDYRLIRLKVNGQSAYLACVYDPSKVVVAYTNKLGETGQYVTKMTELKGGLLGINGAGFYDPGSNSSGATPGGLTIADGKVITDNGFHGYSGGGFIGFNRENVLCLMKDPTAEEALAAGIRDGVSWGPFLVVNGKSSYVSGNGGWGLAARTAIGQRADGTVLLLVVNSNATRSKGASMKDLADIMVNYGAVNAANLDGGTSSVMVMPSAEALKVNPNAKTDGYSTKYRIINDPVDSALQHKTRPIADAFVVLP